MAPNISIKKRINDGELDLAMSELQEVPIKEMLVFPKIHSLDLSNNHLRFLPKQFAQLKNIVKLDLSKNKLEELPDNFGDLQRLKSLDLYSNGLQHLPLSFGNLKALQFLDLKDNPLMPAIAKIVGPCLDAQQCHKSAKSTVEFYAQMQREVETEREKRQVQRQKDKEENIKQKSKQTQSKGSGGASKKAEQKNKQNVARERVEDSVKEKVGPKNVSVVEKKSKGGFLFALVCFLSLLVLLVGVFISYLVFNEVELEEFYDDLSLRYEYIVKTIVSQIKQIKS